MTRLIYGASPVLSLSVSLQRIFVSWQLFQTVFCCTGKISDRYFKPQDVLTNNDKSARLHSFTVSLTKAMKNIWPTSYEYKTKTHHSLRRVAK